MYKYENISLCFTLYTLYTDYRAGLMLDPIFRYFLLAESFFFMNSIADKNVYSKKSFAAFVLMQHSICKVNVEE